MTSRARPRAQCAGTGSMGDDVGGSTAVVGGTEEAMSETKWTPGPWQVEAAYPDDVRAVGGVSPVAQAYVVPANQGGAAARRANARLIAAAPDLYEACEAALEYSEASEGGGYTSLNKQLRAALAKARGDA